MAGLKIVDLGVAPACATLLAQDYRMVAAAPDGEAFGLIAEGASVAAALKLAATKPAGLHGVVLIAPLAGSDADLAAIEAPVLVLAGTKGERAEATRYRKAIPSCHLVLVFDAGAVPSGERPEAVASVAADFFARQDRFIVNNASSVIHP